jgi:hypothetical protein
MVHCCVLFAYTELQRRYSLRLTLVRMPELMIIKFMYRGWAEQLDQDLAGVNTERVAHVKTWSARRSRTGPGALLMFGTHPYHTKAPCSRGVVVWLMLQYPERPSLKLHVLI